MPVKTKDAEPVTAANLRAFFARHGITYAEVARRRGCSQRAVNAALRADLTGRSISVGLLRELLKIATDVLIEREGTDGFRSGRFGETRPETT